MSEPVSTVEFRLGNWVVSPRLNQLQRRRRLVKVTPRVMEVLCELARRAPQPASRQELMEAVWAGRYVGDESLTHAVSELRKALGDNTKHPRYVQTIPKRGYRLLEMPTAVSARDGTGRRRAWASHAPGSESDGAAPPGYPKARARQFRPATLLPVVGVFAVAAGLATLMLVAGPGSEGNPTEPLVTPVTSLPGSEWQPALSPDGERLAFEWQEHINLTVIGSAAAEAITDGPTIDSDPAWSADGARIAFARRGRGECDIHVLVLNLGEDKRVGSCDPDGPQGLSWHPSGLWLAISDRSGPVGRFEIQMLSLATGERHPLLAGDREPRSVGGDIEPSFSPEGRRLAWAQSLIGGTAIRVVEVAGHPPVARGEPATVLQAETEIRGLDWTADGRKLVFATGRAESGSLWQVDAKGGEPELLPLRRERISQPTIARRANRLVFVEQRVEMNLWEAVSNGRQDKPVQRPLVVSTRVEFNPQLSPDGQLLAFASTRSGDTQIWTSRADGSDPERITQGKWDLAATPAWSPDGERIAFSARRDGSFQVLSVAASGGPTRVLASGPANNGDPAYSPDYRWLYFSSDRSGRFEIWKIPAAGGLAKRVTRGGAVAPQPGPGGRYLYYARVDEPGIWRLELASGESESVTKLLQPRDWNNWTVARDGLYLTRRTSEATDLVFWDFDAGGVTYQFQPSGGIDSDLAGGLTALHTPTSRRLIYAQVDRDESDLFLVEGLQ